MEKWMTNENDSVMLGVRLQGYQKYAKIYA